ncbi:MAG: type II toxin-antitoxin system VapC family toxin [Methylococcaceae bacterium]
MKVFFGTSSFVKKFVEEIGSKKVDNIIQKSSEIGISIILVPEIISALNRKLRSEFITEEIYLGLKNDVIEDIEDVDIINLTPSVLKKTTELLEENTLRSLDALHIACAIEWQAELFVSSDERQVTAAIKSNLKVEFIEGFKLKLRMQSTRKKGVGLFLRPA